MTETTPEDFRQFEQSLIGAEYEAYARGSFAQRHRLFQKFLSEQVAKGLMTVEIDEKRGPVYRHFTPD